MRRKLRNRYNRIRPIDGNNSRAEQAVKRIAAITSVVMCLVWIVIFTYGRRSNQVIANDALSSQQAHTATAESDIYTQPDKATNDSAHRHPRMQFVVCTGLRANCVIDGDTFIMNGAKIRIEDIDAPEIGGAKCESEYRLALQAKLRLVEILNAGPISLRLAGKRDADRYGRKLRVVSREGRSIGRQLIEEGLARPWDGGKRPWC
jgi:endonuclease YncB( thermonuclease family)